MRNRIVVVVASLFGALCIYCAEAGLEPERTAKADGGSTASGGTSGGTSGGASGAGCCDTTPKWTKISEGMLSGRAGDPGTSDPIDVSGYKELTLIRSCKENAVASLSWGAEQGGLFGAVGTAAFGPGRIPVAAPFVRVLAGSNLTGGPASSCNYVLVGSK